VFACQEDGVLGLRIREFWRIRFPFSLIRRSSKPSVAEL